MRGEPKREEIFEEIRFRGGAWVFYRPVGGIGDAVMLLPAITALKKQAGDELVVVACIDYIAPIFENHPYIDYLIPYSKQECDTLLDEKDMRMLEDYGCEIIRYYRPDPAVIYESKHDPYMLNKLTLRAIPTGNHIVKSRQEVWAEFAGVKFDINNYNLQVPDYAEVEVPGRYVILQIRSHDKWRDYPRNKWLAKKMVDLGKKYDFQVVAIDSVHTLDVDDILSVSRVNLKTTMHLIKHAAALVGPDSMGVHIAGAYQVPTLGLFGPTDPSVRLKYHNAHWMPKYPKCKRQYCWYVPCKWRFCMRGRAMSPNRIIERLEAII